MRRLAFGAAIAAVSALYLTGQTTPGFDNSFVLAPLYVGYVSDPAEKFARETVDLRRRIGQGRHIQLGFASFLYLRFPAVELDRPLTENDFEENFQEIDTIVSRAKEHGLVSHISIVSGFFHNWNQLRESAIREDVRNAQWFADGWIGPPEDLRNASRLRQTVWTTPSRYAQPLRTRIEEGARIIGRRLAQRMAEDPETLATVSGDGEVELSYERNFANGGESFGSLKEPIYVDYSPFAVAEFRDYFRLGAYAGDLTPATDDNNDGRTFNSDFRQVFATWDLRYFEDSGRIPLEEYVRWTEKLPSSGPYFTEDGFDAPRKERESDRFWSEWFLFRKRLVLNYEQDFANWITSSGVPPERFFAHQIPADYIFGQTNNLRLRTSASYLETAFIAPFGSAGITAFNGWDGGRHFKTATPILYTPIAQSGRHWGVLEYHPSMPATANISPSTDESYYASELMALYAYRPKIIVPFAWTDLPEHRKFNIKHSTFERALARFVQNVGNRPWAPRYR